jgi:hypothetical protein
MATEWAPEARADVALALRQLAQELVPAERSVQGRSGLSTG